MRRERPAEEPTECRSCRALVIWVTWPDSGRRMPVDVAPVLDGNIVLRLSRFENKLYAEKYIGAEHHGRRRFQSHFSSCPQSNQHRRRDAR